MERLTQKAVGCFEYALKYHKAVPGEFGTYEAFFDYSMAVKRLGHYEDTGLEPEEVAGLCAMDKRSRMAKMLRWEEAENDGRLVVLPCKVEDVIRLVNRDKQGWERYEVLSFSVCQGETFIVASGHPGSARLFSVDDIGKTVFLTREEAEAALAGEGGSHE